MSERKRKRDAEASQSQSQKRATAESPIGPIRISHTEAEEWAPIVLSTPGLAPPKDVSFEAYKKSHPKSELILHSSHHPRLDYTAREEPSNGSDSHLKHYIGVYDPARGKLQVLPAKRLVARSTLRSERQGGSKDESSDDSSDEEQVATTGLAARNNLGIAFGTKKSQKAIKNLTVNAINSSPMKAKSNPDGAKPKLDALSEAVLSSMAAPTSSMPTKAELQAAIDESKPIPKPHLDTENPSEVYPVEELVGGEQILRRMVVKQWIDQIKSGGDVPTSVLFVSRRIVKHVQNDDVKKLRVLKYMCLLVGWYKALKQGARGSLRVPKLEEMTALVEDFGSELLLGLGKRFAPDNTLNKWAQNHVLTHILALTLAVDDHITDLNHIQRDLKLETKEVAKLYSELGCHLRPPTETEMANLNIKKAEAIAHRHAQIKLPLTFPKTRALARRKR